MARACIGRFLLSSAMTGRSAADVVEQNVTYEQVKQNSYPQRVSVANRAGEYYQFTCSKPLPAHSFIRRRIDAPLPAEYTDSTD